MTLLGLLGSPPQRFSCTSADSAMPPAAAKIGVRLIKDMAAQARHFGSVAYRWPDASKGIYASRYWLQMRGLYAGWMAAEMIELKAVGDWPHQRLIGEAMRVNLTAFQAKDTITELRFGGSPNPAATRTTVDFRPEAQNKRGRDWLPAWVSIALHSREMGMAVAACVNRLLASFYGAAGTLLNGQAPERSAGQKRIAFSTPALVMQRAKALAVDDSPTGSSSAGHRGSITW